MDKEKIVDTFKCLWLGSGQAPETGIRFVDRFIHYAMVIFFPVAFLGILGLESGVLFWVLYVVIMLLIELVLFICMKLAKDDDVYIRQEDIDKYDN